MLRLFATSWSLGSASEFSGPTIGGSNNGWRLRGRLQESEALLCDEPTGALDYETGKQILKLLQEVSRQQHRTVVLITHNAAIAQMAIAWFTLTMRACVQLMWIPTHFQLKRLNGRWLICRHVYIYKPHSAIFVQAIGRFIAIILIILMGILLFVGIKSIGPNLEETVIILSPRNAYPIYRLVGPLA